MIRTETVDEIALLKAWRERGQGGVLEYLGKLAPPPQWALDAIGNSRVFATDDFVTDAFPMASVGEDGGCWVSAWAHVERPDSDEPEEY